MSTKKITEENFKRALETGLRGRDTSCEYYPCHFEGQDCTWCFCPFYPCLNPFMGGEFRRYRDGRLIWGCKDCVWIHEKENAEKIFNMISDLEFNSVQWIDLSEILLKAKYGRIKTLDAELESEVFRVTGIRIFNLGERVLLAEGGKKEKGIVRSLTPQVVLVDRGEIVGESISKIEPEYKDEWIKLNPALYSYTKKDFTIVLPPCREKDSYSASILSEIGNVIRKILPDSS